MTKVCKGGAPALGQRRLFSSNVSKFFTVAGLKHYWQGHFVRWVSKRTKVSDNYVLHRKNLFIFPTLTGGAFLVLALVIWLLGTNYQNNLILALAYMQMSLFVIVILNTYNNLAGLEIKITGFKNANVGESIVFDFAVVSPNRIGTNYVSMAWRSSYKQMLANDLGLIRLFDFEPYTSHVVEISATALTRGYCQPKYLLMESTFPMGLLRCWTWLSFDATALVYPAPIACPLPQSMRASDNDSEGYGHSTSSGDDFSGFSQYQPGDSPKHIAWTLYAREQGLHRKQYCTPKSQNIWLNWSDFYCGDVELCLSNMSYWANQFTKQGQPFGLILSNQEIPISEGEPHLHQVLMAMALYHTGRE